MLSRDTHSGMNSKVAMSLSPSTHEMRPHRPNLQNSMIFPLILPSIFIITLAECNIELPHCFCDRQPQLIQRQLFPHTTMSPVSKRDVSPLIFDALLPLPIPP